MSDKVSFWFNFSGYWDKKDGGRIFDCWDADVVVEEVRNMTFDRIKNHFAELGFPNPKGIYVYDPDKDFEDGLYVIVDEETCRRTLEYAEILNGEEITLFIDDDRLPFPDDITPSSLSILGVDNDSGVGNEQTKGMEEGANTESERVEEIVTERESERVEEIVTQTENDRVEEIESERMDEREEIPTQCSRPNRVECVYVSPMDYISGDEDQDEDEEEEEVESDGSGDEEEGDDREDIVDEDVISESAKGYFALGMTFSDVKHARAVINEYSVKYGYKLKWLKNDLVRVRAKCLNDSNCPFLIFISKDGENGGMVLKTLVAEHSCFSQMEVPSASQSYIAKYFRAAVSKNPQLSPKDMKFEIEKHLKTKVSLYKCRRAKALLLNELGGSFQDEFAKLGAYADMVKRTNPGSKFEIN